MKRTRDLRSRMDPENAIRGANRESLSHALCLEHANDLRRESEEMVVERFPL
jgi:hypothetical protein